MMRKQVERAAELFRRVDNILGAAREARKRGQEIMYLTVGEGEDSTVSLDRDQCLRLLDQLMGETRDELKKLGVS